MIFCVICGRPIYRGESMVYLNDAPAHTPDCPINETAEGYDRSAPYTALSWFGKTDENLMPAEKIFRDHKNRLLIGGPS